VTVDLGIGWAFFWLVVITAVLLVHDRLAVQPLPQPQAARANFSSGDSDT
jgi:hypothetical protein